MPYYTASLNALPNALIRSQDINSQLTLIEAGFTAAEADIASAGVARISVADRNTALGTSAFLLGTTATDNTAFGDKALQDCTSGGSNTAMGSSSLENCTTGSSNTAIGVTSLRMCTTGANNTATGVAALLANTTGVYNTAFGDTALRLCTTGNYNSASGALALFSITTGSYNTASGYSALSTLVSGSNCTGLGYNAQASSTSATNEITLGNSSIATLRCQVTSITALSDERDKTDIHPLRFGLSFLRTLQPVEFTWDMRDGAKVGIKSSGFIAQDLQEAQDKAGAADVLNLVYAENPDKLEATYGNLIPVLVRALLDLDAQVQELRAANNTLGRQ